MKIPTKIVRRAAATLAALAVGAGIIRAACTWLAPGMIANYSSKRVRVEGDGLNCEPHTYAIVPAGAAYSIGTSGFWLSDTDTAVPDSIISKDGYGLWQSPWDLSVIDVSGAPPGPNTAVTDVPCPSVIKPGRICQGFSANGAGVATPFWKPIWEILYGNRGGKWDIYGASEDTFVTKLSTRANNNYGSAQFLELKAPTTTGTIDERRIYLKFPVSAISSSSINVAKAYLTLKIMWHGIGTNYGAGSVAQPDKISFDTSTGLAKPWPLLGTVFGVSNSWSAATMTWNSGQPARNANPEGTFTLTPDYNPGFTPQFTAGDTDTGIRVGVEVTNQVNAQKSSGYVSFVVLVNGTTTVDFKTIDYASVESPYDGARPRLHVVWDQLSGPTSL